MHSNQIHDFNPGIDNTGLFWTTRLPDDSADVDLDDARASLRVEDLRIEDYFNLGNALFGGGPPEIPATVSFEIKWRGAKRRFQARNNSGGNLFVGRYVEVATATIEWSARTKGFRFESSPGGSQTNFAELGRERNGAFFS